MRSANKLYYFSIPIEVFCNLYYFQFYMLIPIKCSLIQTLVLITECFTRIYTINTDYIFNLNNYDFLTYSWVIV